MRKLGTVATVVIGLALGAAPVAAAPSPQATPPASNAVAEVKAAWPGITVVIDNGEVSLTQGSTAHYRITVHNDSDVDYPNALISQMLPPSLTFAEADLRPVSKHVNTLETARSSEVQWIAHLPARGEVTIQAQEDVGEAVKGRTKLTTTTCVLPDGKSRPMICDSDSDALVAASRNMMLIVYVGLVLAAAAAFVVWRRRQLVLSRQSQRADEATLTSELRQAAPRK